MLPLKAQEVEKEVALALWCIVLSLTPISDLSFSDLAEPAVKTKSKGST